MQEVGIVGSKLYLSPAEAATLLGISRATIYRHMAVGIIRALQLRGRTIIRKSDIEKMFDNAPDYKNVIMDGSRPHSITPRMRYWRNTKSRRKPSTADASCITFRRLRRAIECSTTAVL